jgi:hypothetical protein
MAMMDPCSGSVNSHFVFVSQIACPCNTFSKSLQYCKRHETGIGELLLFSFSDGRNLSSPPLILESSFRSFGSVCEPKLTY